MMKKYTNWIYAAAASFALLPVAQSCDKDDDFDPSILYPSAVVTVKPVEDNKSFYMQFDEATTLEPVNLSKSPFGLKEVRAFVNYTEVEGKSDLYTKKVQVNWIDSLLTKQMKPDLGQEENDRVYGSDPIVGIVKDWVNIVEDGYITLRFRAMWGGGSPAHEVNLIKAAGEDYVIEFRHNAHGDTYGTSPADGIVAFKIEELENGLGLKDTEGKTVDLKFRFESYEGQQELVFKYRTSKSTEPGKIDPGATYSMRLR